MQLHEIDAKTLNWESLGNRVFSARNEKNISTLELAAQCGVPESVIKNIERGKEYSSMNQLTEIIRVLKINPEWLIYGKGNKDDFNVNNLPETVIIKRAAGLRKTLGNHANEEGQCTGDVFEFILAVEKYKQANNKPFPALSEIYDILLKLGYRKTEDQTINPLKGN